jgi:AcrR family transcriptional regulator
LAYRQTTAVLQRKAARREALLRAAYDAVSEVGAPATVEHVARRAGVAVGTVYRYFPSKDHLFRELFEAVSARELDQVAAAVASSGPAAGVDVFCRRAIANPRLARALLAGGPAVAAESERFRSRYADVLSGGRPRDGRWMPAAMVVGAAAELLPRTLGDPDAARRARAALVALARDVLQEG